MNRRAFLVAVGAAACGSPPRRAVRTPQPPPRKATPIASDFISVASAPQTWPSPIAIHGSLLFQIAGDELSLWDTTTMTRTAGFVGAYRQACFLRDGTLAAFAVPPGEFKSELHRIDRNGNREVLIGPLFGMASAGVTRVLPAGAPDQVYAGLVEYDELPLKLRCTRTLQEVVLPEDIAEPGFSLAVDGFLALSADRVVLRGSHHALFAWDAKTGTRVG